MLQRIEKSELKESEEVTSELRSAKQTNKQTNKDPSMRISGEESFIQKVEHESKLNIFKNRKKVDVHSYINI